MAIDATAVRRVLIVEDEMLIAMHLEDVLIDLGHEVVGIATRIAEAVAIARGGSMDFAVLDLNLSGAKSFPVAVILRERGIPFIFSTGYGAAGMVDGFREERVVQKPFEPAELARAIAEAVSG